MNPQLPKYTCTEHNNLSKCSLESQHDDNNHHTNTSSKRGRGRYDLGEGEGCRGMHTPYEEAFFSVTLFLSEASLPDKNPGSAPI